MSAVTYPVHVDAQLDTTVSRWLWLVKWLLALPHYFVLALLWIAFTVLSVVAFFAILFTGHYPRSIFEFNVGVLRWQWRVSYYSYGALGTDRYPPFTLHDVADYPAHLDVDYPEQLSRGLVLVKWWLLAIPHYLVLVLLVGGASYYIGSDDDGSRLALLGLIPLLVVVAGALLLFTGRYPQPLFDLVLGLNRWVLRVAGYTALMTDAYPPFRLDQGGHEGGHEGGTDAMVVTPPPAAPAPPVASGPTPPTPPAPSGWSGGRIVSLVVGCVLAVTSLGLAIPGFALLVVDQTARDSDGFLMSPAQTFRSSTYAVTSGAQHLHADAPSDLAPSALLGDTKLTATATDGTSVFVGIGPAAEVESYLAGVEHATVTRITDRGVVYRTTPGGAPAGSPLEEDFWVAESSGPGQHQVTWSPENGDWAVLVMNQDATPGVAVTMTVGAELPAMPWIIGILLALAGVSLVLAVILIGIPLGNVARERRDP